MTEDLALRHSIQLEKLVRRINKIEEKLELIGSFQTMLDNIVAEHKKDIDKLKKLVLGHMIQPQEENTE